MNFCLVKPRSSMFSSFIHSTKADALLLMGYPPIFSDAFVTSLKSPHTNHESVIIEDIFLRFLNRIFLYLLLFLAYMTEIIHVGDEVPTFTVA